MLGVSVPPHPLDEYPIHQVPLSMRESASSDRNTYDRCIMHGLNRDGSVQFAIGLGVYPNLGVIDAYAVVRRGTDLRVVRASDALTDDRMSQAVGPIRINVVEPLQLIHVTCNAPDLGLELDVEYRAGFPGLMEPRHVHHIDGKILLDASRFVQIGSWGGSIRVDGEELRIDHDRWDGVRDRSWGIRPVGEKPGPGRPNEAGLKEGFWWCWIPVRFPDFATFVILQEDGDGARTLNAATKILPAGSAQQYVSLGFPDVDIRYESGTRYPVGASLELTERIGRNRRKLTMEIEPLGALPLHIGLGYGAGTGDWSHGEWKGRGWVEGATYDLTDPKLGPKDGMADHAARVTFDGAVGYGIFEHSARGRHEPSGFTDYSVMAP
jgi:hypothetical protein